MASLFVWSGGDGSGITFSNDPTDSANWTIALTSLASAAPNANADDTIFVAHDHAASLGTQSVVFPNASRPVKVVCVNRTTGVHTTGAKETSSGNYSIGGFYHISGLEIQAGTSTSAANIILNSGNSSKHWGTLEQCPLYLGNTNAASGIIIGSAGTATAASSARLVNGTVRFSNASQGIDLVNGRVWMNAMKLHASSTSPNRVFRNVSSTSLHSSSCDWSGGAAVWDRGAEDGGNYARFFSNKFPATFFTGTQATGGSNFVEYEACANTNTNALSGRICPEGEVSTSTAIYYTANAPAATNNDGSTYNWSYVLTPNSNTTVSHPLYTPWYNIFNPTTGAMTITSYFAYDNATALMNITGWMEVEAIGESGAVNTPQTWIKSNFPTASGVFRDLRNTGTNYSNSSASWAGTSGWTNKKTGTANVGFTVTQQGFVRARFCLASPSHTVYWSPKFVIT